MPATRFSSLVPSPDGSKVLRKHLIRSMGKWFVMIQEISRSLHVPTKILPLFTTLLPACCSATCMPAPPMASKRPDTKVLCPSLADWPMYQVTLRLASWMMGAAYCMTDTPAFAKLLVGLLAMTSGHVSAKARRTWKYLHPGQKRTSSHQT